MTANLLNNTCLLKCFEQINLTGNDVSEYKIIDKKAVHKNSEDNVMIKEIGLTEEMKIDLFLGNPNETNEITLDHINQEHIEAILLTELCRQASMVSLSKFLGADYTYYIVEEVKKYKNIVNRENKIFIHTLPIKGKNNREVGKYLFTIFQNNKLCLSGYFRVIYNKKESR